MEGGPYAPDGAMGERREERFGFIPVVGKFDPAPAHLPDRVCIGSRGGQPPVPAGELSGPHIVGGIPESAVEDLYHIDQGGQALGEASASPLSWGEGVRQVYDPPLFANPAAGLLRRRAPRDLGREVEADQVDPLRRSNLLSWNDAVGVARCPFQRQAQPIMVRDRDPADPLLCRAGENGVGIREAVPGPPGVQVQVEAKA